MQISLNRANKLYKKLKPLRSQVPQTTHQFSVTAVNADCSESVNAFKEKVKNYVGKKQDEVSDIYFILEDIYKLKNAIFEANMKSGVSQLMNQKEYLTILVGQLQHDILKLSDDELISPSSITGEYIAGVQKSERTYTQKIEVPILSLEVSELNLDKYRKEITQVEDKIMELNATTKIEINLSDASKKVLGL